ncbi:MAG TPA: hypothetical protein VJS64_14780, partial [Pyrinomonadaceae bacterium]|nr:hypothetical protein [Pyrinomonadaceae bacterium]
MELSDSGCLISSPYKPGFRYEPTILCSAGLVSRLSVELRFLLISFRSTWPAIKEDPIKFVWSTAVELFQRHPTNRQLATTTMAALFVTFAVLILVINDKSDLLSRVPPISPDPTIAEILN